METFQNPSNGINSKWRTSIQTTTPQTQIPPEHTYDKRKGDERSSEKKTPSLRIHRLITYFQAYYYGLPQELIKHKIFKYVSGVREREQQQKRRKTNNFQTHLKHNENMKKENSSQHTTINRIDRRRKKVDADPEKWFENLLLIL